MQEITIDIDTENGCGTIISEIYADDPLNPRYRRTTLFVALTEPPEMENGKIKFTVRPKAAQ